MVGVIVLEEIVWIHVGPVCNRPVTCRSRAGYKPAPRIPFVPTAGTHFSMNS